MPGPVTKDRWRGALLGLAAGELLAVNLGDDADTTGAVHGQVAGALYGELPTAWRHKLARRDLICEFADRLCHHAHRATR
jgi:ADP-ribosylglycohydrolase